MNFHVEIEHFAKMDVPESEWGDYVVLYLGSAEVYRWKFSKLEALAFYRVRYLPSLREGDSVYRVREVDQDGLDAFVAGKLSDVFSSLDHVHGLD